MASDRSNRNSDDTNGSYSEYEYLDYDDRPSALDRRNYVDNNYDYDAPLKIDDQCIINACMTGNLNLIQEYVESGHNIDEFLITGWTLLLYAASYAQTNIIQYILDFGGNPNLHIEGYTPLMALCSSIKGTPVKRIKCLEYLIKGGANVNTSNKHRETALMFACKIQETDFILELLKYVDHIDFADSEQKTALFYAVTNNRYDVTKILIDNGADICWISYQGLTAYDVATAKGYDKLLPLLNFKNYDDEEFVKTSCLFSWLDMFPNKSRISADSVDSDVACILYGMGLDTYNACFKGVDLKTFLTLREEDLEKLGVDISVHRKRFVDELLRFHKHHWKDNLIKVNKTEPFTAFDVIKTLGNINKQLSVMSSSINFSQNCLDSLEHDQELKLNREDRQLLENEIKNIQAITMKIKDATKRVKTLAEVINEQNSNLTLPIYIDKKKRNSNKWIAITVITIAGIYLLKVKSLWKKEKLSSNNLFNFSLYNSIYDKFYKISLFLQRGYQLL